MRILIAGTIQGDSGYEEEGLVKNIEDYLKSKGHIVDSFMLPYTRDMLALPDQIVAYQMLDTSSAEMLITVGYPACTMKHMNKIVYLFETTPMLNEYWDSEYGVLANPQYARLNEAMNAFESEMLKEAKRIVCNSQLLCDDLSKRHLLKATVQYYPNIFEIVDNDLLEEDIYYLSETSLLPYHRIELLLDTIKEMVNCKWYLYIPRTNMVYLETLEKQIKERHISDKVIIRKGIAPDKVVKKAVAFLSADYNVRRIPGGVVRCAAFGTTVVACEDGGAIAEYVTANKCGIIENSNANKLAKKLKQLETDKSTQYSKKLDDLESFMRGLTTL